MIVSPLVKVCLQCGFAQNPDAQEACVNCKVDLTLVPVARPGRKFIPRNVAIFSAGIGLIVVGFSLMFLVRSLVFLFIGFIGFLIVSYLGEWGAEDINNYGSLSIRLMIRIGPNLNKFLDHKSDRDRNYAEG